MSLNTHQSRQGPETLTDAQALHAIQYYTNQHAAVTLDNAATIELRGHKVLYLTIEETWSAVIPGDPGNNWMTGTLEVYFSDIDTTAHYETVPTTNHVCTADVNKTVPLVRRYVYNFENLGALYARIPIPTVLTDGLLNVYYTLS